jgi:hypothetical protein
LMLFVAAIFGAGFGSGFAVRATISRQRRKLARERASEAFLSPAGLISDAPLMSPAMPENPIAADPSKPRRRPLITPNSQAH